MTEAVSAAQTKLAVKVGGVWKYFKEVKTIPAIGEAPAQIDATTLDSEIKEYVKDIPDIAGELSFSMNAMPVAATDSNYALIQELSRNDTYEWRIEYSQLGVQATLLGQWTWSIGDGAVSSVMEYSLTIIPKSKPVISSISATYTLTYDKNAEAATGTMTDSSSPYANGTTVTVKANTFENTGKRFINWNTRANNSGTSYDESDTFPIYANTTLYAIWSE